MMTPSGPRWAGEVRLVEDHLDDPLRWRKPKRVFVNSMSDLFHEALPDDAIDAVFARMIASPRHTFQILTKRPARMRAYLTSPFRNLGWRRQIERLGEYKWAWLGRVSRNIETDVFRHIWLGVSVEDQATTDERVPLLMETPASVRFVSAEPLLGLVDLSRWLGGASEAIHDHGSPAEVAGYDPPELDWLICGGESGPYARPMHPYWARALRDQCLAADVPFHFKQWGAWAPPDAFDSRGRSYLPHLFPELGAWAGNGIYVYKCGAYRAGRLLDGRVWDQFPGDGMQDQEV